MMENDRSVFARLREAIRDGKLEEGFYLDPDSQFAPGAEDGIALYHTNLEEASPENREAAEQAVRAAADGDAAEALRLFETLGQSCRTLYVHDAIQDCLIASAEGRIDSLRGSIEAILREARTAETVKSGLTMLELIPGQTDGMKEIVRTFALCDEFTLYAVWIMLRWPDAQAEIFRIAQAVHGWGRVHAIEYMEPETQEVKDWLLYHAADTPFLKDYCCLTCWKGSGASERLRGQMTHEEYKAISVLVEALLESQATGGITALPEAEETLRIYMSRYGENDPDIEEYRAMEHIKAWANQG